MAQTSPVLHMVCGKIASGKSSLTAKLATADDTVLIAEDEWLSTLFGDSMSSVADYVRCAAKLRGIMGPHVADLLKAGLSVVLDFAANTVEQRAWMRGILDQADAAHMLHVLDVPDAVCLERLQLRNARGEHPFVVTEEQFWQVSRHFQMPAPEEAFNIVRHEE